MSRSNRKRSCRKSSSQATDVSRTTTESQNPVATSPYESVSKTTRESDSGASVEALFVTPAETISERETGIVAEALNESSDVSSQDSVANPSKFGEAALQSTSFEILESLQTLVQRFDLLDGRLDGWGAHGSNWMGDGHPHEPVPTADTLAPNFSSNDAELQDDLLHLQSTLDEAWRTNEELRHQNETLAAQIARSNVHQAVRASQGGDESLSWEERKQLIMQQMEEDSFDADEFVNSLSASVRTQAGNSQDKDDAETVLSPHEFLERLAEKIQRAEQTILNRDDELGELRMLLENQSQARADGTAIGAAAIASMIDSDALVMEERERLQQLKNDWEDKFRQAEIDASLERAKLSRERQQLAKRTQELEEKLDEVQRERRDQTATAKPGRRWLAELGLSSDGN